MYTCQMDQCFNIMKNLPGKREDTFARVFGPQFKFVSSTISDNYRYWHSMDAAESPKLALSKSAGFTEAGLWSKFIDKSPQKK